MFLKKPLLDLVRSGRKTQTLRNRKLNLSPGHIISFGGHVRVIVEKCDSILLSELDEGDANREGFSAISELKAVLKSIGYEGENPRLSRIIFRLKDRFESA